MPKNPAAVALGSIRSKRKAKTSAENGKLGGRRKYSVLCLAKNGMHPECADDLCGCPCHSARKAKQEKQNA